MYLCYIYNQNNTDTPIEILGFENDLESAFTKLENKAMDFIIDYEGRKKLETANVLDQSLLNNLPNGYYFVKKQNSIVMYKRISKKETKSYWLSKVEENINTNSVAFEYRLCEFQQSLLSSLIPNEQNIERIEQITSNKPRDILLPNKQVRINLDELINEMKNKGFKTMLSKVDKVKTD